MASYTPAAQLQGVVGWKQRQAVAQLLTGLSWLAVETGRHHGSLRAERVCKRCSSGAIDNEEHLLFNCGALEFHLYTIHFLLSGFYFITLFYRSRSKETGYFSFKRGFSCNCVSMFLGCNTQGGFPVVHPSVVMSHGYLHVSMLACTRLCTSPHGVKCLGRT